MSAAHTKLLEVEDLWVRFQMPYGLIEAVRGISFTAGREKLGIVGESGSGKTLTGRAILRMLPARARLEARKLSFDGIDLMTVDVRKMQQIRGRRITMIMQDPKFSLNPTMKVGDQIAETAILHGRLSRAKARDKALAMLKAVRIDDPLRVLHAYPHELSGGMGQRVMIAMMLITGPDLLVADEPTSALDVTVQRQVLDIIGDLVTRRGMGLIFISHDLNLVGSFCDRVLVMYGGQIVETVEAGRLLQATHPYTRGLLAAMPRIEEKMPELPVLQRDPAWLALRSSQQ